METICQKTHCHLCCIDTNMHLTQDEITRIQQQNEQSFYIESKDGWFQLKNQNGRCIFHDDSKCTIYPIRPMGCRLYPIVYNADEKQAIYDTICPHPESFPVTPKTTQQLHILINILFKEKIQRQAHNRTSEKKGIDHEHK